MATKNKINIHRYEHAPTDGWVGYAEDSHKTWLLFFDDAGRSLFYPSRDPVTGSVDDVEPTASS